MIPPIILEILRKKKNILDFIFTFSLPWHIIVQTSKNNGVWLSLVERTTGGREVAGSNPVIPMKKQKASEI